MPRKKPGPKGLLKNPRPTEQWVPDDETGRDVFLGMTDEEIAPDDLDYSERSLHDYIGKRRAELWKRPAEKRDDAMWRLQRLAAKALSDTPAVWWSGYARGNLFENPGAFEPPRRKRKELPTRRLDRPWNPPALRKLSVPWGRGGTRRHVGPTPPPKAEHKALWLDTSTMPAILKDYDKHTQTWTWNRAVPFTVHHSIASNKGKAERFVADLTRPSRWLLHTSWPVVMTSRSLRDSIARMLRGEAKLATKSGRPGYLACATLGVLLHRTPEQIADFLANHRRSLRPRRPPG